MVLLFHHYKLKLLGIHILNDLNLVWIWIHTAKTAEFYYYSNVTAGPKNAIFISIFNFLWNNKIVFWFNLPWTCWSTFVSGIITGQKPFMVQHTFFFFWRLFYAQGTGPALVSSQKDPMNMQLTNPEGRKLPTSRISMATQASSLLNPTVVNQYCILKQAISHSPSFPYWQHLVPL